MSDDTYSKASRLFQSRTDDEEAAYHLGSYLPPQEFMLTDEEIEEHRNQLRLSLIVNAWLDDIAGLNMEQVKTRKLFRILGLAPDLLQARVDGINRAFGFGEAEG